MAGNKITMKLKRRVYTHLVVVYFHNIKPDVS
jgi:hypothetical protein